MMPTVNTVKSKRERTFEAAVPRAAFKPVRLRSVNLVLLLLVLLGAAMWANAGRHAVRAFKFQQTHDARDVPLQLTGISHPAGHSTTGTTVEPFSVVIRTCDDEATVAVQSACYRERASYIYDLLTESEARHCVLDEDVGREQPKDGLPPEPGSPTWMPSSGRAHA